VYGQCAGFVIQSFLPQLETDGMKRIAIWAAYAIGAISVAYIALYIYAVMTAPRLEPGDPIRIFRKPDAPKYSALTVPGWEKVAIRRLPQRFDSRRRQDLPA